MWTGKICPLTEGCPKVKSAAHCLFGSVVEVVSERWSHLGFSFNSYNQCVVADNKQVPFLGWPKETGKFNSLLPEYITERNSCLYNKFREKVNKAVHLGSTRDGTTETLIGFTSNFLFLPLGSSCFPVMGNRFCGPIVYMKQGFLIVHDCRSLSNSSIVFQIIICVNVNISLRVGLALFCALHCHLRCRTALNVPQGAATPRYRAMHQKIPSAREA